MGTCVLVEGVWMCTCRQLRRLVRRRTASLLLVITVLILMSLSVTPPPALAEGGTSHVSLGHRRIQQQGDDDYTGPKPPPAADPEALRANDLPPPPPPPPPPKDQQSTSNRKLDGYVLPKEKPRGGETPRVFSLSMPRRTSPSVPSAPFLKAESPSGQSRIIAGRTVPPPWLASRPSNLSLQDATPFREGPRGPSEEGPYNLPILKEPGSRPQRYGEEDDVGVGHVQEVVRKEGKRTFVQQKPEGNVIAAPAGGTQGRTNASQPRDVYKSITSKNEAMVKVQLSALTALQHGHKLTQSQKKSIEGLSPSRRRVLEERAILLRRQQDRVYLNQLRSRKQIQPLPGGGERIVSSSIHPIRFPPSLKKMKVDDWPSESRVFLNLTHYPWAQSENCKNFSTTFAKPKSLPTAALASFPSSGNTWIRYLIESSTGIYTGSMYDDNSLTRRGMFGEGVPYDAGITILQKSHGFTTCEAMMLPHEERLKMNHMEELGNNGIIVVRNPFKALISHRHLDAGGHTGYAPKAHFIGEGWTEFVTLKIGLWKDFYVDWLTYNKPERLHVIFYENLKNNLAEEVRKALKFLKVPIDEKRLKCMQEHSDGLFKRKPPRNNPLDFDPFLLKHKNIVYNAIDEVNRALLSHKKNALPLELYEMYDNHEAEAARRLLKQK